MPKPQLPAFTYTAPASLPEFARRLGFFLGDCLGIVQDFLRRTPTVDYQGATSPPVADVPFRVSHDLGEIPRYVSGIMEASGSLYATSADKQEWTATYVKVRCSATNCVVIIRLES